MPKILIIVLLICIAAAAGFGDTGNEQGQIDLQRVFDRIQSGERFTIREGIYYLPSGLKLEGVSNVTITGEGEVWLLCEDLYSDVIRIVDCSGVSFINIKARHLEPLGEYMCNGGVIQITGSDDIVIDSCELNGCGAYGVGIDDSESIYIENCLIHNNSFAAVYGYNVENLNIINNRIFNNASFLQIYNTGSMEIRRIFIADNGENRE